MTKGATRLSPGRPTANASLTRPLTDISPPPRHIDDELLTRVGDTYELTPQAGRELTALLTDRAPGCGSMRTPRTWSTTARTATARSTA
ncbi:hypothetical protein PV682_20945 [Streptomyces niveiscabiei]|uniref:hypothetical protein n=1 Tax=Streptomyces niveiscabiei TaxID=164115 RepID=UPI0029A788A6|nr:hypothetical protein [Streptomyces niveiscabiei]MDX3383910.1 hypothetical protein [Streptomyces niveiscabiei]